MGNRTDDISMNHKYTESEKYDGQYLHLLKLEKRRKAHFQKPTIRVNLDFFSQQDWKYAVETELENRYMAKHLVFCLQY